MKKFWRLFISIAICELVGLAAVPFTVSSITTWYAALNKPSFSPPNWIFGPVWTILYFMMGVSVYLIWQKGLKKSAVKEALSFFVLQLLFNFLWSFLFFYLHSPLLGFVDIVILLGAIIMTAIKFNKISKLAAYLLLPYFFWVLFATLLNLAIVVLN